MRYFWPILAVITTNTAVLALGYYVLNIRDLNSGNMMMLRIIAILASLIAFFYMDQVVKKYEEKKREKRRKQQEQIIRAIDAMTVGIFFDATNVVDVEIVDVIPGGEDPIYESNTFLILEPPKEENKDEH